MRVRVSGGIVPVLLLSTFFLVPGETSRGGAPELSLGEVRAYEVEDFDHPSLRLVGFPPDTDLFLSLKVRPTTRLETSRPFLAVVPERQLGELGSEVLLAEPGNVVFDSANGRLFLFEATSGELLELWQGPEGATELARLSALGAGLGEPGGLAVAPGGESLFVFDRAGRRIVQLDLRPEQEGSGPVHLGEHRVMGISLEAQGLPELGGLAFDPASGHFLVLSSTLETLYEFSDGGRWVKSHDLSGFELVGPVRLLVAPSADLTDDPSLLHLYLADGGGEGEALESRVREFSLSALVRVSLPAAAMETASLIQVIDTSALDPASPEVTGVAYLSSLGSLLVSGSEVSEMQIFTGESVFEVSLYSSLLGTGGTEPESKEPTGVGFASGVDASGGGGRVFFTDDTGTGSYSVVDLGLDGLFGTGDDEWRSISTGAFGAADPQGITFDSEERVLFLVDGVNSEVYRIDPGPNDVFDGVPLEGGDDRVTSFDTAGLGVTDPEGIAFHPVRESLYVVGKPADVVIEVTTSGAFVSAIDISVANAVRPSGLAVAPGSRDSLAWSVWVADRGVGRYSDPSDSGGRIYELAAPNSRPVANPDSATTAENTAVTIDVAANDTDADGNLDPATANTTCRTCSEPSSGALVNNGDGTFTYTPSPGFGGMDSFVYEICDTAGKCDTATVSIQVGNPPVANDDSAVTLEDTLVTIDVAANDSDPEGSLDHSSANTSCPTCSEPSNGTLSNNADGTFDYTPSPDFSGGDSFGYEICDASLQCDTATVTVTVSPVNDPPVANDDAVSTADQTLVTIDVSANDTDVDGDLDPASANTDCAGCSLPMSGTLVDSGDGTFDYTPDPGYSGPDTFVYEICDTAAACDTATVTITVGQFTVVEIRVAASSDDAEEDTVDGSVSMTSSDLEMIQESNEQVVGIRFVGVDVPQGATIIDAWVQFQVDETTSITTTLTLQGEAADNGVTFSSSALDISSRPRTALEEAVSWSPPPWLTVGEAGPDQQTPNIASVIQEIVSPLLHVEFVQSSAPVANNDAVSTPVNTPVLIDVAANDTDLDGNLDPATTNTVCATCSVPANGTLVNNGDGTFTYTPNPSYNGPDSFVYEICDTEPLCDTATVSIAVAANDTDADGNLDVTTTNVTCPACSDPSNGSLVNNGNGAFDYTPNANYSGPDSFTYEICDTAGACDTATVTVTVNPVADPPVANDDEASTIEDTPVVMDVAANDMDADGNLDPATANTTCGTCSGVANGLLVNNSDGTFTYTSSPGYVGPDGFVYEICDTDALCDTGSVAITVSSATHVLVGAGDIADCGADEDDMTADLLDNIEGTVITLGDNVYPNGTAAEYADCYDPTWGRHKARTKPSAGNHEYDFPGATGYFNYFGAAAGDPAEGWYSYDVGDWHVIVLNSNCSEVGGCEASSPQGQWLQADLAANPSTCIAAYWHDPRFHTPSSGTPSPDGDYLDFWQALYDAGADVVLHGHRHVYERFAPQDPNGNPDPNGIREFIVGNGGKGLSSFGSSIAPNSEVRDDTTFGVLKLTLYPTSYDWELVPIPGGTFTDSGSGTCSGATSQPPVANDDAYSTDEDVVLNVAAPGVLGNDSDPDGEPLTAVLDTDPSNGTLTLNLDGSFDYTPDANFNGTDTFAYRANDGSADSNVATVTITVSAVNDSPVANDDTATTSENTPVLVDVLANDTDVDGNLDPTSVTVTSAATNGTTAVDPLTGAITYTPDSSYTGPDSFVYEICDTGGLCDVASVAIIVSAATAVLAGAGDIVDCFDPRDEETAALLDNIEGTVITLGDNVYDSGTDAEFTNCYDPSWGRHKARTKPSVGDNEYKTPGASGYFNYFGAAAGDPAEGWYSYDVGEWHIIVLNSNCTEIGGCDLNSPQGQWLQADLAANPSTCTLAYWHLPRFATPSSGTPSPNDDYLWFWQVLDGAGAELVLAGHRHVYERFAPQDPTGALDPDGIRQIIVGTGGKSHGQFSSSIAPNSEVRDNTSYGVLKLTLHPTSYDWEFIPVPGDTFTDSGSGTCSGATTNQPPVANDDGYTTDEDSALNIAAPGVLGNDTDADGDPLTAVLNTGPANGSLTLNTDGSFDYIPDADFNGVDSFGYFANDGSVNSVITATVTITVTAVPDVPVADDQSVSMSEDTAVGITLTASDGDGDPLTYSIVSGPSNGSLSGTPPSVTYTPNADFNGGDSFTFQANDGSADSNLATVTITVNAVNDAPVANDQSVSTDEDTAVGITLTASDIEGDPLTYAIVSGPSNGSLSGPPPSVTYTPNADFNGPDSFTFQANDGSADSNVATVSITVNAVNDSPVANDDSATTSENTPVLVDVLTNDTDVDGNLDPTSVTVTSAATNGTTAVDLVTGEITYTPNASYVGGDSFVYRVCDTGTPSLCDLATVTMTVTVQNDPPVAVDDGYVTDEDTLLTVLAPGVLANDSDPDSDPLTAVWDSGPSGGTLILNADGSFDYTPDADFAGQDSFGYFAYDGLVSSVITATVTITVTAVNDSPVADDQSVTTPEDTPVGITLTANDVDGDPLTYSIVSGPSSGSLSGTPPSVTYTPNADFNGGDSFTFQANDGGLDSNVATVSITVAAVNDPPVADDQSVTTDEDTPVGITLTASDVDGDPLTYAVASSPSNGGLSGTPPSVTYTPDADFNGSDSFTFQANDGSADSNVATVSITVNAVNDAPVANDDSASTPVNTLVVVDVAANDVDVEGLDLSSTNTICVGCSGPSNGTLVNNGDGTFEYTPNASYTGGDSFVYEICDNDVTTPLCDTATVSITVTPSVTTLMLFPSDDAYVDSKKPTANHGSDSQLQVRAGAKELDSYLKFSVPDIGTVLEAKLRLFVLKDSPDGGSVYTVSNAWGEVDLVWDNAPEISGTPLATAGAVVTGTWVELDVTSAIVGNVDHSFALTSGLSNAVRYSSKEGGSPPELVITFQ
jgi:VCBS repeat-containing protein